MDRRIKRTKSNERSTKYVYGDGDRNVNRMYEFNYIYRQSIQRYHRRRKRNTTYLWTE